MLNLIIQISEMFAVVAESVLQNSSLFNFMNLWISCEMSAIKAAYVHAVL